MATTRKTKRELLKERIAGAYHALKAARNEEDDLRAALLEHDLNTALEELRRLNHD